MWVKAHSEGERMTKTWLGLSIAVGLVFLLAVPGCTDFQTGVDAYVREDYDTALKEFRPLAEQGNAKAQYNLGLMYFNGQGVAQDDHEAMKWFRLAAMQGNAKAQFTLGNMYYKGKGLPQDYVLDHLWLTRAAEQGFPKAVTFRETLEGVMIPEQLSEAQRLEGQGFMVR